VDLSPYAGRTVKLRLSVEKGPEGRGAYAWAVWGEPRIVVEPTRRPLTVEALTPRAVVAAAGPAGRVASAPLRREGNLFRYRLQTQAPGATCLLFRTPAPVALPLDLRTAPFAWASTVDGMALPKDSRPAYLTVGPGEGSSGGVTRPALMAHPPIGGATAIDYLLTLPKIPAGADSGPPAQLRFSCAIQDGACGEAGAQGTNGIAFVVALNGQEVSRQEVARPDGWHEGSLDLGAYAGQTVLLSLIVDALGEATCDWARWGEPRIEAR